MQFLIVTRQRSAIPPEMVVPIFDAMKGWAARYQASGEIKAIWSFAGTPGGGGVIEVSSHEQLDAVMAGYPFAPFSETEVIALSDLNQALDSAKAAFQQMMAAMPHP